MGAWIFSKVARQLIQGTNINVTTLNMERARLPSELYDALDNGMLALDNDEAPAMPAVRAAVPVADGEKGPELQSAVPPGGGSCSCSWRAAPQFRARDRACQAARALAQFQRARRKQSAFGLDR